MTLHLSARRRIVHVAILGILISMMGCYSSYWGTHPTSTRSKPDESRRVGSEYDISVASLPTVDSPILTLSLRQFPIYPQVTVQTYSEYERFNWWKTLALSFGVAIPVAVVTLNSGSAGAAGAGAVVALGFVLGGGIYGQIHGDDPPSPTGKTQDRIEATSSTITSQAAEPLHALGKSVLFDALGRTFKKGTDVRGEITIDVVNDLGMETFESNSPVAVEVSCPDLKCQKQIRLDPSSWTIPHLRIELSGAPVETEENGKLVILGKAKKGQIYPLLQSTKDLMKIQFGKHEGYVSAGVGRCVWIAKSALAP